MITWLKRKQVRWINENNMESTGKKKIVIIGPAHPLRGGLATFNHRMAIEFLNSGHQAEIVSYSLQYPKVFFPGKTQLSGEPAPSNLTIHTWINSVNPLNWIRTGFRLKNRKPDIIIIRFWIPFMAPCLGVIARIVRTNRHTRIVAVADNIIPHEKRPFDRLLAGFFIKSVQGFITMSKKVLEDLALFDKHKPRIFCHHPLYDNFGSPVPKSEAIQKLGLETGFSYILFFGFIRDYKGLDILLKAFSDPRIQQMPLKLIVAGEFYTDAEPYYSLIRNLGLSDKVILRNDFIPDSGVRDYFCAADLVAQPYKSATQSGVTQIAYHFGKPMIITDVGGLSEIVPDNRVGYAVSPDPEAIADAIVTFYQEQKEELFSRNASVEKEKFSWKSFTDKILDVSEKIKIR